MSKLGKIIVLRIPEGERAEYVLDIVKHYLPEDGPQGQFVADSARLLDLDEMKKALRGDDDWSGSVPPGAFNQQAKCYNAALRDIAGAP